MQDPSLKKILSEIEKINKETPNNPYITKKESIELIKKAYYTAKKAHEGQVRRSGDPFILHPVAVTLILIELRSGPETLCAALLHDTVEDTDMELNYIKKEFGSSIAGIVDGATKVTKLKFKTTEGQAKNQQKMLLATAKDIRVMLIKIADRLHNMTTLEYMKPESQVRISKETLETYAPIAHRLGLFGIKAKLEDLALKYIHNDMYMYIKSLMQATIKERESKIQKIIKIIKDLLKKNKIKNVKVEGRAKHFFSIYKKMMYQEKDFEDIYDLLAVRVIVNTVTECYQVLGIIHSNFTPIPNRFKDYIAMPKPNMYQSLHTTVFSENSPLFEVQIRTYEMDNIAEYGVAAHWAYKENVSYSREKEQFDMTKKLRWYSELLKYSDDQNEMTDPEEFVDAIKNDVLKANVYVFTPKGEIIELPKGSTPIDFAYSIHTEVGNTTVGATVNNKIVPLNTTLQTGDIVGIRTDKKAKPSSDWLKIVKSGRARTKINSYLNKNRNRDVNLQIGKNALETDLGKQKIKYTLDDNFVKKHYYDKYKCETVDDLYIEIGKSIISTRSVITKLQGPELYQEQFINQKLESMKKKRQRAKGTGLVVKSTPDLDNMQITLANCCRPVYGDEVIGYTKKTGGIVAHIKDCVNLKPLEKERFLELEWVEDPNLKYEINILMKIVPLTAQNKQSRFNQILGDIVKVASTYNIDMQSFQIDSRKDVLSDEVKLTVSVKNINDLRVFLVNLRNIKDVYSVERLRE